jgi:uncharacterized OB-fold protein
LPLLPYPVVIIDLDEGVRILGNIAGDKEGLEIRHKIRVGVIIRGENPSLISGG